jgi:hypothetical protein
MEKSVMKKSSKHYELDYKRQIVGEYMSGKISAEGLAQREGARLSKAMHLCPRLKRSVEAVEKLSEHS